jgi:hypothetical protein
VLASIRLGVRRVKEKASAPQRLECMHLQSSSDNYRTQKKE